MLQETVRCSRWSSFVDESADEIEESLQNVININGSVVPVTTDSTEYQGTRNNWRKRRADRSNGFVYFILVISITFGVG